MKHLRRNLRDLVCVFFPAREPATPYDASYAEKAHQHAHNDASREEQQLVADFHAARHPARVLDVGCNTGAPLDFLCRAWNAQGAGVDVNLHAIEFAQASLPDHTFAPIDGSRLPFDDEEFDHVCLHHVIGHVPQPEATLREIFRVLRPNGTLSVITPNAWFKVWQFPFNLTRGFLPDGTILRYFSRNSLCRLVRKTGFRVLTSYHHGARPTLCPPLIRRRSLLRVIVHAEKPSDEKV